MRRLIRIFNAVVVALLKRGLPFPPYTRRSGLVIQTIGRRTGKPRLTPVGYRQEGNRVYVVAESRDADWVRNLRTHPRVTLYLHGRPVQATAHLDLSDDPQARLERMRNRLHAAAHRARQRDPVTVVFTLS
ncbi:MAG: nitroreductase family deazaflavin-dependent oxidoreductase [Deltaproteobacteria bacterium]|nr:nitroreductase family deazaflavin-dependent oxidoreductase [Deltaproteobacteria bacterium]MBI3077573.1 nitroreductase family deazaflavin-dependent oxidoreductase [Deltaproteobacteria bacterium]